MSEKFIAGLVCSPADQEKILKGNREFPIRHNSRLFFPEEVLKYALYKKEYKFAEDLVKQGIVSINMDLLFVLCDDASVVAMNLVLSLFETKSLFGKGKHAHRLETCLIVLFLKTWFTQEMKEVAIKLSKLCDINNTQQSFTHIVGCMLNKKVFTLEKVKILITCGVDFSSTPGEMLSSNEENTVLDLLTHGIDISDMIEILILIREYTKTK